jgi:excisionase family DNA binding protein
MVRDGFAEIAEAQEYLRLSRSTIYSFMETGVLAYARFGRRRRIPWRALRAYAAQQVVGV